MSRPGNTPDGCPRELFGGDGPRSCTLLECASHLRQPSSYGPSPSSRRVRLMVLQDDTCARDVRDRARALGVQLTRRRIGELMGISEQAVDNAEKRGLRKLRIALGVEGIVKRQR